MRANQAVHRVATMCRVLDVSSSGYYAWRSRRPSRRAVQDAALCEQIRASHERSRGTYGAPRVWADLRAGGVVVSRKRVARLMRALGLAGVSRRRPIVTTRRSDQARPAPDLVERVFTAKGPNRLWVADITYVPTAAGFVYLAVVVDVWSRRVVGWSRRRTCAPSWYWQRWRWRWGSAGPPR
jgi:putative transposase